jgi:hypothetical protein
MAPFHAFRLKRGRAEQRLSQRALFPFRHWRLSHRSLGLRASINDSERDQCSDNGRNAQ